eukprot:Protomagalhaensia_sp_Gyna_25__2983@NODE_2759_length_901_cov_3212_520882_g2303_i0_p1_GENE_NODE_2759_length_901_cov_3212_520882_g2303_i0NODE_2759_length_901_cov_3212_520882_g2303_i0_p1_ORF_typecomplete_len235_score37_72_NODE_2759_length_901_cov_3212_520882_g2303_i082705
MARFTFALLAAFVAQAQDTLTVTSTCQAPECVLADPPELSAARVDSLIACLEAVAGGDVACEVTATITQESTVANSAGHFTRLALTGKALPEGSSITTEATAVGGPDTCVVTLGASNESSDACTAFTDPMSPTLEELGAMCGTYPSGTGCAGVTAIKATTTIALAVEEATTDPEPEVTEEEVPPPTPEGVAQTLALTAVAGILATFA